MERRQAPTSQPPAAIDEVLAGLSWKPRERCIDFGQSLTIKYRDWVRRPQEREYQISATEAKPGAVINIVSLLNWG